MDQIAKMISQIAHIGIDTRSMPEVYEKRRAAPMDDETLVKKAKTRRRLISPFEWLLSDNGPIDCLELVLEHLDHGDIEALRKASDAICNNPILEKIEADKSYRGLLEGFCRFPKSVAGSVNILCGHSHRSDYPLPHQLRACETHQGSKMFVCAEHRGFRWRSQAGKSFNVCQRCENILWTRPAKDAADMCQCPLEPEFMEASTWSCRFCIHWWEFKGEMIRWGRRCEECFPDLKTFLRSEFASKPLSDFDPFNVVKLKRLWPLDRTAECIHKHRRIKRVYEGECQACHTKLSVERAKEMREYQSFSSIKPIDKFAWCKRCGRLTNDPRRSIEDCG